MSQEKLLLKPGVNSNYTPTLNEAGWSVSQNIRFFNNLVQKIGGWAKYVGQALYGFPTGLFAWEDLNSIPYVVAGTQGTLEVAYQGQLYDITPQLSVQNLSDPFTTIINTNTMSVHDVAHGELANDVINIVTETSINGQLLIGYQTVFSVTDADNYIVNTNKIFTASVSGATTALFTTTMGSPIVTVTLVNHGRMAGAFYTINVSTTVGGLILVGQYVVASVIDADNFTFSAGGNAGSAASGRENGGNIRIDYLIHGSDAETVPNAGYGVSTYSSGQYGITFSSSAPNQLRQWFFGNWGSLLISNFTGGGIYVWDPAGGVTGNPATIIATAPTANSMFIAMPERQVVALGAAGDPLLIKWSDVDDYTQWTPDITNQAGSYRLPRGSRIVGGLQAPQMGLIWTDLGIWAMQYIQPPLVYGFTEIATSCGLVSARAKGILGGKVYWMSKDNFYMYDGTVNPVPCTVWDKVFNNLNNLFIDQTVCAVNSAFNEISWFFPTNTDLGYQTDEIGYVKYNAADNVWDYGFLGRTAWIDQSVAGNAMGTDFNGFIFQHEIGNDDGSNAMEAFAETGLFKISNGLNYMFIERMIPDYFVGNANGNITVTITTVDYPGDYPDTSPAIYPILGPRVKSFDINNGTEYIIVRLRGRLASVRFSSNGAGVFWRLGEPLFVMSPIGRR